MGEAANSVTGVTARSAVGESAVQLIGGAAYNNLSNINIEQSGGSGLDLGGGVKPQVYNTATNVVVPLLGQQFVARRAEGRDLPKEEACAFVTQTITR